MRRPEHGVKQVEVPWAEVRSRFTALFECLAITVLQETNILASAPLHPAASRFRRVQFLPYYVMPYVRLGRLQCGAAADGGECGAEA